MNKKIIFSFTTSPKRILLVEDTINSILNQTVPPTYIRINIPKIFKRTNEKYIIPDFIKNNKKIKIYEYNDDLGPIMKILPTLEDNKKTDNIIIYGDDDVLYMPHTIETYIEYINKNSNYIYCLSGFNYKDINLFNDYDDDTSILKYVQIPEGYMSVCINCKCFNNRDYKKNITKYYNKIKSNKDVITSDDLILGNYYAFMNIKIKKISTDKVGYKIWWDNYLNNELLYGKEEDALQNYNNNGHMNTYIRVYEFLKYNNINYL